MVKHFRYVGFVRSAKHGRTASFGRNVDSYDSGYKIMRLISNDENLHNVVEAFLIGSDGEIVERYPSEVPPMNLIPGIVKVNVRDYSEHKRKK